MKLIISALNLYKLINLQFRNAIEIIIRQDFKESFASSITHLPQNITPDMVNSTGEVAVVAEETMKIPERQIIMKEE